MATIKNKISVELGTIKTTAKTTLSDSYICNERLVNFNLDGYHFLHSIFEGIAIKNAKFKFRQNISPDIVNCDFSHCVFRGCYFRYVKFRDCKFINCRFIDCEFPESSIVMCDFSYAQFQNTHIEPGNVLSNLPIYENLRVPLLRSVRMNYSNRGEGDHARQCFLQEMEASAEHYWKIAFDKHSFFRDKYNSWMRFTGFFKWAQIKIEHWIWGYGESPIKLLLWAIMLVTCFSFAYLEDSVNFPDAFKISAFAFATVGYGEHLSTNTQGINWLLIESLIGIVFVGLLAASLFKWISRRQR